MVKAAVKVTVDCSVGLGLCNNLHMSHYIGRRSSQYGQGLLRDRYR